MSGIVTSARLLTSQDISPDLRQRSANRQGFAQEYPFASHWFCCDGFVQHYVDEGHGPVVLMVHGNPTWSFAWRKLIGELSKTCRVVAIDHLGCGFSEKPQDRDLYTLDGHIRRLQCLVELLNLQDVTLVGHDWGGAIGMGCAGRNPQRFRRFILMNTGAFRSTAIPRRIAVCRIPVLGRIAVQQFNMFSLAAISMAVERPLDSVARAGLLAPYDTYEHRIAVHEFVQDIPLQPSHRSYRILEDVENGLHQFRNHPMLLVWGMKDWCFTPAFLEQFRQRFPMAESLTLPNTGHYIFEDAPQELSERIQQFLEST